MDDPRGYHYKCTKRTDEGVWFSTVCAPPDIRRRAQVTTVTNMIVVKTDTKREVSKYFKQVRQITDYRIQHWINELIKDKKKMSSLEEQVKQQTQILQALMDEIDGKTKTDE